MKKLMRIEKKFEMKFLESMAELEKDTKKLLPVKMSSCPVLKKLEFVQLSIRITYSVFLGYRKLSGFFLT